MNIALLNASIVLYMAGPFMVFAAIKAVATIKDRKGN